MNKGLFFSIIVISFLIACSGQKQDNTQSLSNKFVDTTNYTTLKVVKMFCTLTDGSVKELAINADVKFSDSTFKVVFGNDSTWNFEIKESINKKEGTTFILQDKKYKEVFISSGSLPMITFTTHTETGNITLM